MTDFRTIKLLMDSFEPHFHHLYVRPNEEGKGHKKDTIRPKDRSLFVLNVPPYITQTNLQNAFEDAGELEQIFVCQKPGEFPDIIDSEYFQNQPFPDQSSSRFFEVIGEKGPEKVREKGPEKVRDQGEQQKQGSNSFSFKCAYLVFKTSRGLQNALKLKQVASGPIRTGMEKWCEDYLQSIPDVKRLQEEIDTYIAGYDERKQREEEEAKDADAPDDDGWVTVTKKANHVIEKKESVFNKIEQKEQGKKKRKELKDFYRFQLKDSKVKQLATLRKRFEEDKKKVEILRNTRRFKPF